VARDRQSGPACPPTKAGALLAGVDPNLAALLSAIPYTSSITLSLGYEKAGFSHPLNGFGFLVPKRERRRLVACTWVGTKFSYRVPDHLAVLRCFIGGGGESDEALVEIVRDELRDIMGVSETPLFTRLAAGPAPWPSHGGPSRPPRPDRSRAAALPGLHLAGNAYTGIGIPDCIRMGRLAAERIVSGAARPPNLKSQSAQPVTKPTRVARTSRTVAPAVKSLDSLRERCRGHPGQLAGSSLCKPPP